MSYGGYQQYGGNPYGSTGGSSGGYGASNPYESTQTYTQDVESARPARTQPPSGSYGQQEQYGGQYSSQGYGQQPPPQAPYSQPQSQAQYGSTSSYNRTQQQGQPGYPQDQPQAPGAAPAPLPPSQPAIMSNQDFLARVEAVKAEIRQLTSNIAEIGSIHQRLLNSPDSSSSSQLEATVSNTQVLNTRIKDQIKQLETDAAKSGRNQTKDSQIRTLKANFKSQLEEYQREEQTYRQRYRDQIARQYRIVNPEASEQEVREAADANWGDEGVFQTALKSNRTGAATSVLGTVRARHNDIQQIERTLIELNQLFQDLAEQVILQEPAVQQIEEQTTKVHEDTTQGNKQLDKGIVSARRARKLKWVCFGIVVAIIVILALVLGLFFGLQKGASSATNGN